MLEKKQQQHRQHAKEQPQSDDEDEGRSSLGRNKRKIVTEKTIQAGTDDGAAIAIPTTTATPNGNGDIDDLKSDDGSPQRSAQRKKPASYLDELLSERSKKKKRKRNKKQS